MNKFKQLLIRTYQKILYLATFFLGIKEPKIIKGENSFVELCNLLKEKGKKKVLLVTDAGLHSLNMDKLVYDEFINQGLDYALFFDITANPTVDQVEEGLKVYKENNCDSIVVIGGGSAMDAAKIIGARATNNKPVNKMKGLLKITHKLPLLIAIPTTAGTGSETTLAAVISNPNTKEKFPIEDPHITPKYTILNPKLLVKLPPHITSTTGMDALTHAVEAYIGKANTKKTKQKALNAVKLTFKNLQLSYEQPENLTYRENMQVAAFDAGVAFTRAYVGYVHAIAHTLGGVYHVPHGLANAIVLPYVLKEFGKSAHKKLAELYDIVVENSSASIEDKANTFIAMIEDLNYQLNIPSNLADTIKEEDIDFMVNKAYQEAIPLYPTPTLWTKETFKKIFIQLSEQNKQK